MANRYWKLAIIPDERVNALTVEFVAGIHGFKTPGEFLKDLLLRCYGDELSLYANPKIAATQSEDKTA